jgi:hypothetical protein
MIGTTSVPVTFESTGSTRIFRSVDTGRKPAAIVTDIPDFPIGEHCARLVQQLVTLRPLDTMAEPGHQPSTSPGNDVSDPLADEPGAGTGIGLHHCKNNVEVGRE